VLPKYRCVRIYQPGTLLLDIDIKYLDNRGDELIHEAIQLEKGRPKVVDKVDYETLDVRAIMILEGTDLMLQQKRNTHLQTIITHLIGHDHQLAITQILCGIIRDTMLQAQDLFDVGKLGVAEDLLVRRLSHVQRFTLQREDAITVTPDNTETRNSHGFRRISFRQDQGAVLPVFPASLVGVI